MATFAYLLLVLTYTVAFQDSTVATEFDVEGYYWRDYTGEVPRDALPGGVDEDGQITYIGQTVYKGHECEAIPVPGPIKPENKEMTFEWGRGEHVAKRNVKILCTQYPEHFEWTDTNTTEIKNIPEKRLISGGLEQEFLVYIGRVHTEEQFAIGKILVTPRTYLEGLHTTVNGKYAHFYSYQVLAYNPVHVKVA